MKTEVLSSKQTAEIQIISLVTLILLLISFLGLTYKIYAYKEIRESISAFDDSLYTLIAAGNFLRFILLIFFGALIYKALRINLRINIIAYFALVSGFFTILFMFFEGAALHDIINGEEDKTNEWKYLITGIITSFLFYAAGFIAIFKIRYELRASTIRRKSVITETFFEIIQYIGIVSSTIGLGLILFAFLVLFNNQHEINRSDIAVMNSLCLVIFLPYISIILYWLIKLIREKNPEPYDEKQKHDLSMAGLVTWILSIPIVIAFALIDNARLEEISKMIYLPLYLFATLLMFSISALRNFRKS